MSPHSLRQDGFARALRSGDRRVATALRRLTIHRNHQRISLTAALAATYPVVARLVGDACFAGLAREFIMLSPPASPCLFEYGGNFAGYLDAVPTLMTLPYLPDVARLEWALNQARHAADAPRLPAAALGLLQDATFAEAVISPHPSLRLLASPFPVARIWRANQPDADPAERIALDQGGQRLLLYRDSEGDTSWCPLSLGQFILLQALRDAVPLGRAWSLALADDPAFDGRRTLAGLLAAGVFTDLVFPQTRT